MRNAQSSTGSTRRARRKGKQASFLCWVARAHPRRLRLALERSVASPRRHGRWWWWGWRGLAASAARWSPSQRSRRPHTPLAPAPPSAPPRRRRTRRRRRAAPRAAAERRMPRAGASSHAPPQHQQRRARRAYWCSRRCSGGPARASKQSARKTRSLALAARPLVLGVVFRSGARRVPHRDGCGRRPRGAGAGASPHVGTRLQKCTIPREPLACAAAPRSLQTLARAGSFRAASGRSLQTLGQNVSS